MRFHILIFPMFIFVPLLNFMSSKCCLNQKLLSQNGLIFVFKFFRGISTASVSKSVGVLDLSIKDKSVKPPRRLSIPAKSTVRPAPKLAGNITPISEARVRSSATGQGKSDTPVSNVSRTTSRKKFSVLSSASYWISQIKLSESAAKHSISLGFFKLALEAGCEVCQFAYFPTLPCF